ncbi:hypothetical protein RND81_11G034600 [Saponaria officinalis]|uniref:Uncharacterized protein n=1 Tax=Saponaria officinalis TaxID=3572 RepID=A0AAW1HHR2_SAPOF
MLLIFVILLYFFSLKLDTEMFFFFVFLLFAEFFTCGCCLRAYVQVEEVYIISSTWRISFFFSHFSYIYKFFILRCHSKWQQFCILSPFLVNNIIKPQTQ